MQSYHGCQELQRQADPKDEVQAKRLPKGSSVLLRQDLLMGEVPRGSVGEITGYHERMARNVISDLQRKGYLKSKTKHSPLVLSFPIDAGMGSSLLLTHVARVTQCHGAPKWAKSRLDPSSETVVI
jgi:hypothetical protein